MIKKVLTILLVISAFLSLDKTPVKGQSYSFQLPKAEVNYSIEADGTATIEYTYVFVNNSGAPDIEFVDIGMPAGSDYDYNDMSGEIDGQIHRAHPALGICTKWGGIRIGIEFHTSRANRHVPRTDPQCARCRLSGYCRRAGTLRWHSVPAQLF